MKSKVLIIGNGFDLDLGLETRYLDFAKQWKFDTCMFGTELEHGLNEVKVFLMKLGLTPIVLREQANSGYTIIEKIEKYTNVGFCIVLYTPCDDGKAKEEKDLKSRARQNVVFEHGYLCAKLKRNRVCALVKGDIEVPGDLSGVVYIKMDGNWRFDVVKELKAAGYPVDANKLLE